MPRNRNRFSRDDAFGAGHGRVKVRQYFGHHAGEEVEPPTQFGARRTGRTRAMLEKAIHLVRGGQEVTILVGFDHQKNQLRAALEELNITVKEMRSIVISSIRNVENALNEQTWTLHSSKVTLLTDHHAAEIHLDTLKTESRKAHEEIGKLERRISRYRKENEARLNTTRALTAHVKEGMTRETQTAEPGSVRSEYEVSLDFIRLKFHGQRMTPPVRAAVGRQVRELRERLGLTDKVVMSWSSDGTFNVRQRRDHATREDRHDFC